MYALRDPMLMTSGPASPTRNVPDAMPPSANPDRAPQLMFPRSNSGKSTPPTSPMPARFARAAASVEDATPGFTTPDVLPIVVTEMVAVRFIEAARSSIMAASALRPLPFGPIASMSASIIATAIWMPALANCLAASMPTWSATDFTLPTASLVRRMFSEMFPSRNASAVLMPFSRFIAEISLNEVSLRPAARS